MIKREEVENLKIGVVGLGLMGSSIVVALLLAGHQVIGIAPLPGEIKHVIKRLKSQLRHAKKAKLLSKPIPSYLSQLCLSEDYKELMPCRLVQECVTETEEIKAKVYREIVANTRKDTVISSNTSAIPISTLQKIIPHPQRFVGIHWAEPAI